MLSTIYIMYRYDNGTTLEFRGVITACPLTSPGSTVQAELSAELNMKNDDRFGFCGDGKNRTGFPRKIPWTLTVWREQWLYLLVAGEAVLRIAE